MVGVTGSFEAVSPAAAARLWWCIELPQSQAARRSYDAADGLDKDLAGVSGPGCDN